MAEEAAAVCADSWRVAQALAELLVNAVEHGNLGLGHAEKAAFLAEGRLETEISRRLAAPPYAARRVQLTRERRDGRWVFEIADEGRGFDWRPFLEIDPVRRGARSGRGIALARQLAFPDLVYLGSGNRARCSAP